MPARKPHVGDLADHRSGQLDPRPVAEVSPDGRRIRLSIFGTPMEEWVPARNYRFSAPAVPR